MRFLGLVFVAAMLSACAGARADSRLDADAKLFRAPIDKACLYVTPTPGPTAVTIALDGRKVGTLDPQYYLRLEVVPGRHVLSATPASFVPTLFRDKRGDVTVETEAGGCYYLRTVWTDDHRGWRQFRVFLERTTEEEGQRAVNVLWLTLPGK